MKIAYILTMPNIGSWNGSWTGSTNLYARTRGVFKDKSKQKELLDRKNFFYDFGDGWGANVEMSLVTESEANKMNKITRGFYGYEWMINSIEQFGEILNSKQRISRLEESRNL